MVAGEGADEATDRDVRRASNLLVLGSSAGGIEALSRVVADLPAHLPAAVVIAQHLDPRRSSHLAEILERHAVLPIRVIDGTTRLEDGVIFVVPENRLVEVTEHGLRLRPARRGAIAPSVDLLFASAARTHGERVIAVVMTGTGSDGSAGAWTVKQAGGTVVIENPETAMFASMPASVSPSLVDATADLDTLGNVIVGILHVIERPAGPGRDDAFSRLLDRIRDRSGIDFGAYKPATIVRRLEGRMRATGSADIAGYAALIERDAAEYDRLISSLLIKVTGFFRDARLWDHLRDELIPGLLETARRERRELRVWSAGCSSGEEAYSLAMTIAEAQTDGPRGVDVRIFGTDIDPGAIAFARRGIYPAGALHDVPSALRSRYFIRSGPGFEVVPQPRVPEESGDLDQQAADQPVVLGRIPLDESGVAGDVRAPGRPHPTLQAADDGGRLVGAEVDPAPIPDAVEQPAEGVVATGSGGPFDDMEDADDDVAESVEVGRRINQRRRHGSRHRREHGGLGVLDDDGPAGLLHGPGSGRSVDPVPVMTTAMTRSPWVLAALANKRSTDGAIAPRRAGRSRSPCSVTSTRRFSGTTKMTPSSTRVVPSMTLIGRTAWRSGSRPGGSTAGDQGAGR